EEQSVEGGLVEDRLLHLRQRELAHAIDSLGTISKPLIGAGHTCTQIPQALQRVSSTRGRPASITIAPSTGHRSLHVEQNDRYARHAYGRIRTTPSIAIGLAGASLAAAGSSRVIPTEVVSV